MNKHRFVWHDLNTKDINASKQFYGEMFNWKFESSDNGPYVHIASNGQMIGGMRQMSPQEPTPPSWLGYIGVDDVGACVSSVTSAGGKVMMPPQTIPNTGTFAVVSDPTGGVFAPWKSARGGEDHEPTTVPPTFSFVWDELMSTNTDAAIAFYTQLFGWKPDPQDMGAMGTYTLLQRPGVSNPWGQPAAAGGVMKSPPGINASWWLTYVSVDNADQRSERATKLGAKVMVGPMDIPNVGRFACWSDPQGAAIGILQPSPM